MAGDRTPDPVVALGRQVARTARQVDDHAELIRTLADSVTALSANRPAAGEGPVSWLAMRTTADPHAALGALTELLEWLDGVYRWYPGGVLPACWLWHPWVVEELLALRAAHVAAYTPGARAQLAVDWHDKQRPAVAARIAKELATHTLEQHRQPAAPPRPPLGDAIHRLVTGWVLGPGDPMPAPTSVELDDAAGYDRGRQQRAADRDYKP